MQAVNRSTWQRGPLWLCYAPSSPLHRPSICSFTPSLVSHSFHLDSIWLIHLNIISFCSLSGSVPEWGRGPRLNHCIPTALAQLGLSALSNWAGWNLSMETTLGWGWGGVDDKYGALQPTPTWFNNHQNFFISGGTGINAARYKDLTGRNVNEEEQKASPSQVHLSQSTSQASVLCKW